MQENLSLVDFGDIPNAHPALQLLALQQLFPSYNWSNDTTINTALDAVSALPTFSGDRPSASNGLVKNTARLYLKLILEMATPSSMTSTQHSGSDEIFQVSLCSHSATAAASGREGNALGRLTKTDSRAWQQ